MGRNVDRNRQARQQRRQAILSEALRLFASRGLSGTKISDIAAAVGISPGLLYHYFPSKDAVFVRLIEGAFADLNEAASQLEALTIAPNDKLKLALGGLLKGLEESDDAARMHLFIAMASVSDDTPPAAAELILAQRHRPYETIARIMAAGQAAGTVRPGAPQAMAQLFWSTIKGLAIHRAVHGEAYRSPDASDLLRLFLIDVD